MYENAVVLRGLTWEGIGWAFSGFRFANWQPLTWLSHMLDVELFGLAAGAHHAVSVALHLANLVLLGALLRAATGAPWRSLAATALFALHPLRVEPVAWISSRKDVLSTLLLLLALRAWVSYARGRRGAYAAALAFTALGLMAKPMLVTVPVLLLLLDVWPLGRAGAVPLRRLLLEKVPFGVLALAASFATWLAQTSGGGESALSPIAAGPRVANALASYGAYLGKALWPVGLASFYPHPATVAAEVPLGPALAGALLVAGATTAAVLLRRRLPYLAFGWFWYAVALAPVAGFLQVGGQAMADRYAYVPLVGPFVAVAWGAADLAARLRVPRFVLPVATTAALAVLAAASFVQVGHWEDSFTLHRRSVAVTERNWKAWHGLCAAELDRGRAAEALRACAAAVAALPAYPEGWQTLGVAYGRTGERGAAMECFRRALALRPDYFNALRNLGAAHANAGEWDAALSYYRRALAVRPTDPGALGHLARAAWQAGERGAALEALAALRAVDPVAAQAIEAGLGR